MNIIYVAIIVAVFIFFSGIRIVRPTHRGLIERLGKYHHFANAGFNWIMPEFLLCRLELLRLQLHLTLMLEQLKRVKKE